jgi:hypothetical protein
MNRERSGWMRTLSGPAVLVGAALVASRLLVFFAVPQREDLGPYPAWAREYQLSQQTGVSYYEVHDQEAQRRDDRARAKGLRPAVGHHSVEYPPLAMTAIQAPAVVLPPQSDAAIDPSALSRYIAAFRLEMLAFDLFTFGILALMTARLYSHESAWERAERLLLYLTGTALLGHLLYNRLDIAMAALVLLALALLVSRAHYLWSFLALAVAVNFKLAPVVLLPVWALGALPATWPGPGGFFRSLPPLLSRAALLLLLIAALFLPFWLANGWHTLEFLAYHQNRGLEIESTYSSALMCLRPFGLDLAIDVSYGSYNLRSSWSPALTRAAGVIAAALLAAASLALTGALVRRPRTQGPHGRATLAQTYPLLFILFTLLVLLLFVAANKVFSPQYLFWLAPLAALAPFRLGPRRVVLWGFVGLCALTTLIYPVLFWRHVVGVIPQTMPEQFRGPSALGMAAVVVRNALFVGLTALAAALAWSYSARFLAHNTPEFQGEEFQSTPVEKPGKRVAAALASFLLLLFVSFVSLW